MRGEICGSPGSASDVYKLEKILLYVAGFVLGSIQLSLSNQELSTRLPVIFSMASTDGGYRTRTLGSNELR